MQYQFLIDSYQTEIEKVLSVWSMFDDEDILMRPNPKDPRGRNLLEHMVHQCASEDFWFSAMLGIQVTDDPLLSTETRIGFIRKYHVDALSRLAALTSREETWWSQECLFFEQTRSHAWVLVRRIAHTAHHRGQQTALLRVRGHRIYSTYGPTADTGGLMRDHAPTVYAYSDAPRLILEEANLRRKARLPEAPTAAVTERPAEPHISPD